MFIAISLHIKNILNCSSHPNKQKCETVLEGSQGIWERRRESRYERGQDYL